MKQGIDAGLLGLGKSSIHELTRDDLLIPENFAVSAKG
jgi:L-lactate dehydrogenase (cytochrome)